MNDKIKIAFFDVDGTLYNHQINGFSKKTVYALKKLKENGIMLCIATGRPLIMVMKLKEYLDEIGFEYLITNNGQAIFHKDHIVYRNFLHPEDVKAIIKRANELDYSLSLIGEGFNIITKLNDLAINSHHIVKHQLPRVVPIDENFDKPVDNIVCYEKSECMKYFKPILKHSVMTSWSNDIFDFVPDNGVKVNGIKKVLNHLKLDSSEAIAFGDGENDREMLKYVGFGVAMGNSNLEVQEEADYVCESIYDEGVYHTLIKTDLID